MTQPTIISEEPLNVYEAKKEIAALKKRDEELGFRATRCDEYVSQFTPLTQKDAKALKEELTSLEIPRLKEEHVAKLIDIMPFNADDIKTVLSGYALTVKNENVAKIEEALAKYR